MASYSFETNTDRPLRKIRQLLRSESQNRVIHEDGMEFYQCLASCVKSFVFHSRQGHVVTTRRNVNTLLRYDNPKNIRKAVRSMLKNNERVFRHIIPSLVDDLSFEESDEKDKKQNYKSLTEKCTSRNIKQELITCCIYLSATCMNTPIYVMNADGHWEFFPPLLNYKEQPQCVMEFITMHLSADFTFYMIESTDRNADPPTATGILGMYQKTVNEIPIDDIDLPEQLRRVSSKMQSDVCFEAGKESIKDLCQILWENHLVTTDQYEKLTSHRNERARTTLVKLVWESPYVFDILCKVLMKQGDTKLLKKCVADWQLLVMSCEYLQMLEALFELDDATFLRNISVANFIALCQSGRGEIDERRRKVTTTVIASSSLGLLSGGLIITGIVLAPVSFGASLGLSIAGGVLGVGTGVASGVARTVEAVKQNSTLEGIENIKTDMEQKERNLKQAIENVERLFQPLSANIDASLTERPGISLRGFLAVGSAAKMAHSAVAIGLAAARLGTNAAAVAAAVMGPISVVFDLAFLVEAAVNKKQGDETKAGKMLENMVKIVSAKDKILNSFIRGNFDSQQRMIVWT